MGNTWDTFACIEGDSEVPIDMSAIKDTSKSGAQSIEQYIWEFQRYQKSTGWGAGQNFEANDPGRYASFDRCRYGDSFQSVMPDIPDGYRIDLSWAIVIKKRRNRRPNEEGGDVDSTEITDRFGWHYGRSFSTKSWVDSHQRGMDVRRRLWRRILIRIPAPTVESGQAEKESSSALEE